MYDIANNRWVTLFSWQQEPNTAQSPTKTMAMGAVSPIMRKGTRLNGSPKAGGNQGGMTKNNFN